MSDQIFSFFGQVLMYGGGSVAVAYWTFQLLGQKWIDNKFSARLQQQKHEHEKEIQKLRIRIEAMLGGSLKVQANEFEILPDAWQLLHEAWVSTVRLTVIYNEYPDLNNADPDQVEEELNRLELLDSEKQRIRDALNKNELYIEAVTNLRIHQAKKTISEFNSYVEKKSILMPPEIKSRFDQVSNLLWDALSDKEMGYESKDYKIQNEAWKQMKEKVEPLRKSIGEEINIRLHSHASIRC